MKKNKLLKIAAVAIFFVLIFTSAVEAFVSFYAEEYEYRTSFAQEKISTIIFRNSDIDLWEDNFNDESKIDQDPPGDGKSESYVVSDSKVTMANTYSVWTDPDWTRMRPITLTNNEVYQITDYQIYLTVDNDSDMQSDYDDLRFKHENEPNTWLDYWIEKYDSLEANVWVEIPTVPIGQSTLYMFYGNGDATSEGDFSSVFPNWDKEWSDDVQISNHYAKEGAWDPDVAYSDVDNGQFLVIWEEGQYYLPPFTYGYKQELRASIYEPDGTKIVNDKLVYNDDTTWFRNEDPSIAHRENGEFFVAWENFETVANPEYTTMDILGRTVEKSGSDFSLGSVKTICDATHCQADPNVVYDSVNDKFAIAWEDARDGGSPPEYCIYATLFNPSTGQVGSETTIIDDSSYSYTEPWIAFDSINEQYMIVFERGEHPAEGPFDIMMGIFDTNLDQIGDFTVVAEGDSNLDYNFPCVEFCKDTELYLITWNSGDISDNDWWGTIYGAIYDSSGDVEVDTFTIADGEYIRTDIVNYLFSSFMVSYDDGHSGGTRKIWGKLISPYGEVLTSGIKLSQGSSAEADWANMGVGADKIFVSWEDIRVDYSAPWDNNPDTFGNIWFLEIPDGTEVSYFFGNELELILEAYVTSIKIDPDNLKNWDEFFAEFSDSVTFDILDGETGSHIQSVNSGDTISGISATSIRLMASFSRSVPTSSPNLDSWNVSWTINSPPNTPSNPDPGDGQINVEIDAILSWTGGDPDGDDVTYNVFFEEGDSTPDELVSENQSGVSYDPGTLDFDTTYYWQIVSYDSCGASTNGPVWSFTTKVNNPPNIPSGPNPSDGATNVDVTIDLSWTGGDPDGDDVFYDVYFGDYSPPPKMVSNQSSTSYDPGTLDYDTTYYWKIIAWDEHGDTAEGPEWDFSTRTNNPPNQPSNPNPANGATNVDPDADLSWTGGDPDSEDTVVYDVYFGTYSPPPLAYYGYNDTTYDPGTMPINTKHYWKIVARDNHGAETEGPLWEFTTKANNPPNQPSNPNPANGATNVDINTNISWTCSDPDGDPLTYDVYFEAEDSSPDVLVSSNQSGTSYDPGTLDFSTTYYWQIIAWDEYGDFTAGPIWSFTTSANNPPNIPSDPDPEHGATNVPIDKILSWSGGDPDGDDVTYNVFFGDSSPPQKVTDNQSETSYSPGILDFETTYYWQIVAYDVHGESADGPEWYFTTTANNPPNKPFNPDPSDGTTDVPVDKILSWSGGDPDGDDVFYDVYFGTTTDPPIISNHQSSTEYDPDLVHNTTYYWKIVAWDVHETSTEGDLWEFKTLEKFNNPPNRPTIRCDEELFGLLLIIKPGVEYTFEVFASDFDGDNVYYYIDWGDGTSSEWDGPHPNGIPMYFYHTWTEGGWSIGAIKAKAKDIYGAESDWGTLNIIIDRGKPSSLNVPNSKTTPLNNNPKERSTSQENSNHYKSKFPTIFSNIRYLASKLMLNIMNLYITIFSQIQVLVQDN
ncbi:MAG: DUF2341 domain-containing protein [Thermoplasmatales archaeon]|nr:MAG: DUF2341 domain-containing protein [Thermoplasmatales archaeon]